MIIIWTLLTAALTLLSLALTRDFACPAFVSGVVWTGAYLLLIFRANDIVIRYDCPFFFLAQLFFTIGFFVSMRRIKLGKYPTPKPVVLSVSWNSSLEKIVIALEYVMTTIFLLTSYGDARTAGRSLWQSFRYALYESEFLSSWGVGFLRSGIAVYFLLALCLRLLNPSKVNNRVLIASLPPVLVSMLFSSRGDWFFMIISCAFMFVFIRRPRGWKVVLLGLFGTVLIMTIFFASSFDKFSNAWTWETPLERMRRYATSYFVMPPVGLTLFLNQGFAHANGKYTFRLLCALLKFFFPNMEVVPTVQGFFSYGGYMSNVYTSLHWYAMDFGFWWACLVEGVLGIIYGALYKRMDKLVVRDIFVIVFLSMLMMPLCNQFFDEKVFSILSTWLQRAAFLYIFLHSPLVNLNSMRDKGNQEV